MRRTWILTFTVVLAFGIAAPVARADGDIVPRYSRVAAAIAGWPVPVRCWNEQQNWNANFNPGVVGIYSPRFGEIELAPQVCFALAAAANVKPRGPDNKLLLAEAVQTLAHESEHAHGIRNERPADCYGMQQVEFVATNLGLGRRYGRGLARLFWVYVYNAPGYIYSSPKCYEGGPWDLYERSVWP